MAQDTLNIQVPSEDEARINSLISDDETGILGIFGVSREKTEKTETDQGPSSVIGSAGDEPEIHGIPIGIDLVADKKTPSSGHLIAPVILCIASIVFVFIIIMSSDLINHEDLVIIMSVGLIVGLGLSIYYGIEYFGSIKQNVLDYYNNYFWAFFWSLVGAVIFLMNLINSFLIPPDHQKKKQPSKQ